MIDRNRIAEAATTADLDSEGGMEDWATTNNVDIEGVVYVAEQRALRAAMLINGQDPRKMSLFEVTSIRLPPALHDLMPMLAAVWADGFAAGLICGRSDDDPRGSP